MSETILRVDHGEWIEITLNRPDKLNSFNDEMHLALRSTLDEAKEAGVRAILITGSGRGFCAGQDLGDRDPSKMSKAPDLSQTLIKYYNPLIRLIRSIDAPVICAINGVAAGAGANVALACDIVLASDKAKFVQSFANVGLVPDAGGTWSLTHLLGEARAKGLALTGESITAEQAAQWGLIWKCIPADELMQEARNLTMRLAQGPTVGFSHIKKSIHASRSNTLDEHIELEASYQKICGETPDYAEGVSAFLNKRKPKFSGKLKK